MLQKTTWGESAVRDAAYLLDAKGPTGWADRIDVRRLDLTSLDECVLGQVYGHRRSWLGRLLGRTVGFSDSGFSRGMERLSGVMKGLQVGIFSSNIFREEWVKAIQARQTR